ncbi:MAG: hypothetical protein K9H25_17585 [Rhodospirillum sp.]|nr:hypothetical protein [Rhodospirillum sp.]MCF8490358.1 hypothetical protein [Rhodospirillum sp.]MCF8501979.1 hypothetical protein [Rhodospirillum sp.]
MTFADSAWGGGAVPSGQHCSKFGGHGATPGLTVGGIPGGTTEIQVEFNDASYAPLSSNGGHGKVAFTVSGSTATLPSVPGETATMPSGVRLVSKNRAQGDFAVPGYLPPCSGGAGNTYFAVLKALDSQGKVLGSGRITLGTY